MNMETSQPSPSQLAASQYSAQQAFCYDRQHLQKLIDLLDRYDLSVNASTDNTDLCRQLRALAPF
jgi:hypothetical protein